MIIAVNIGKSITEGKSVLEATERAWKLNIDNCKTRDYVIGVVKGEIKGCFVLKDVFPDKLDSSRVAFDLEPCFAEEDENVRKMVQFSKVNLKGIQRGKYI
jgi:phage terminase large subunit-like protein